MQFIWTARHFEKLTLWQLSSIMHLFNNFTPPIKCNKKKLLKTDFPFKILRIIKILYIRTIFLLRQFSSFLSLFHFSHQFNTFFLFIQKIYCILQKSTIGYHKKVYYFDLFLYFHCTNDAVWSCDTYLEGAITENREYYFFYSVSVCTALRFKTLISLFLLFFLM